MIELPSPILQKNGVARYPRGTPAIIRFAAKCKFEPETGCVLWIGGKSSGHGRKNNSIYGVFRDEGFRWFAHRWAAVFIHGLDPGEDQVGHWCPYTGNGHPNPLCVEHVRVETVAANVTERNHRRAAERAKQTGTQRLFWKLVELGYEEEPEIADNWIPEIPRFEPPHWLEPYL